MDVVKVTNLGTEPLVDAYDGEVTVIGVGEYAVVPRVAANLWFGNGSIRNDDRSWSRGQELHRIRVRYGVSDAAGDTWLAKCPKVEVTTLAGDPVPTLLDDPDGKAVTDAVSSISDQERLYQMIEQQQRDLAEMRKKYEDLAANNAAQVGTAAIEVDQPETPHRGKAKAVAAKPKA